MADQKGFKDEKETLSKPSHVLEKETEKPDPGDFYQRLFYRIGADRTPQNMTPQLQLKALKAVQRRRGYHGLKNYIDGVRKKEREKQLLRNPSNQVGKAPELEVLLKSEALFLDHASSGTVNESQLAQKGFSGPSTSYPYKDKVEQTLGLDLSGVKSHLDPLAKEACQGLAAEAYTFDGQVAFNSANPSFSTAVHEAVHLAQQAGMPLTSAGKNAGSAIDLLEKEAYEVEGQVAAGKRLFQKHLEVADPETSLIKGTDLNLKTAIKFKPSDTSEIMRKPTYTEEFEARGNAYLFDGIQRRVLHILEMFKEGANREFLLDIVKGYFVKPVPVHEYFKIGPELESEYKSKSVDELWKIYDQRIAALKREGKPSALDPVTNWIPCQIEFRQQSGNPTYDTNSSQLVDKIQKDIIPEMQAFMTASYKKWEIGYEHYKVERPGADLSREIRPETFATLRPVGGDSGLPRMVFYGESNLLEQAEEMFIPFSLAPLDLLYLSRTGFLDGTGFLSGECMSAPIVESSQSFQGLSEYMRATQWDWGSYERQTSFLKSKEELAGFTEQVEQNFHSWRGVEDIDYYIKPDGKLSSQEEVSAQKESRNELLKELGCTSETGQYILDELQRRDNSYPQCVRMIDNLTITFLHELSHLLNNNKTFDWIKLDLGRVTDSLYYGYYSLPGVNRLNGIDPNLFSKNLMEKGIDINTQFMNLAEHADTVAIIIMEAFRKASAEYSDR